MGRPGVGVSTFPAATPAAGTIPRSLPRLPGGMYAGAPMISPVRVRSDEARLASPKSDTFGSPADASGPARRHRGFNTVATTYPPRARPDDRPARLSNSKWMPP